MLRVHGRPRINRVDFEIPVLWFKDVLKISFLFHFFFFFCIPLLKNFKSTSCLEGIETFGMSLSGLSNVF